MNERGKRKRVKKLTSFFCRPPEARRSTRDNGTRETTQRPAIDPPTGVKRQITCYIVTSSHRLLHHTCIQHGFQHSTTCVLLTHKLSDLDSHQSEGQVVDALATPVVGLLADRLGNRKMWHFLGTITVSVSFPLIFMHCPGSSSAWSASLYYATFIVVFQIGWAMVQISHLSLITDLTPSKEERAELTAIRYTASVCAGVGVYSVTWVVFHATKTEFSDKISLGDDYKFRDIVIAGGVVGLITTIWFHLGVPKTNTIQRITESRVRDMTSLWQGTLQYLCSLVLLQVALLYVASRMFHTLCLVYMPLYLSESVSEDSESLATVPLLTYIASFVPSFGIKYLSNNLGNKTIYMVGAAVSVIACLWIQYGSGEDFNTRQIYGVAVLLGIGSSTTMISSLCLTADLIGIHTEQGAFVYSAVTFADKLLNGIVVFIIEYLECPSKDLCPHYYRDILVMVCGGSALLGMLVLATLTSVKIGQDRYQSSLHLVVEHVNRPRRPLLHKLENNAMAEIHPIYKTSNSYS
uniref:Major facilitator superfamily domain-containing protein 12-like n=1 Tax=Timema shepardi TaxID=629360 RepID=A0A7R9AT85_TIMSH|nr:unnamed protein product [Timema shepardi]